MNNAGIGMTGECRDMELSDWKGLMDINLWGPIYGVHYVLPHMIERGSGHIINVSSSAGLIGMTGVAAYCTSKFGIVGFSEVLRFELAPYGIGVTLVCPGFIKTDIFRTTKHLSYKDQMQELPKWFGIKPESLAKDIIKAVKKNKFLLITSDLKPLFNLKRFSPLLYTGVGKLMSWNMARQRVEK